MEYSRAISQISEIHQHLTRTEVYRGYRPVPVALSGVVGLMAAAVQTPGLAAASPVAFVMFWSTVAALAAVVGSSEIAFNFVLRENAFERRRTRIVIGQFLPSLLAAMIVTLVFVRLSAALVPLLPGLWALMFGVAVFGARLSLPRATGWVALFYFCAGVWLLAQSGHGSPSAWSVGGTFGAGQLLAALVLAAGREREK